MPVTCVVNFENNPQKVVYAGQLLRGTVRLTLTEQKSVRSIFLLIHGESYACWSKKTLKTITRYSGREDHLSEKTIFVGGNDRECSVSPGTYNYNFDCMLSENLPSSMIGRYGHIKYTATVVLEQPPRSDKMFINPFTVIKPVNLNDDLRLREPIFKELQTTLFAFCGSGPDNLEVLIRTPVRGYTPGQFINLDIKVKNRSSEAVSHFEVDLFQEVTYFSDGGRHKRWGQVPQVSGRTSDGCLANQNQNLRLSFQVPPLPPTDCESSKIIHIEYSIHVTGPVAYCHGDPVIKLPIKIGTYPIQDDATSHRTRASNTVAGSQSLAPAVQPSAPSTQPVAAIPIQNNVSTPVPTAPDFDDDPPTYEEATQDANSNKSGDNFKPKYPMFRRHTSYSIGS